MNANSSNQTATAAAAKTYFIMVSNGIDHTLSRCGFGPFIDLAEARIVESKLKKHGVECGVYSDQYAKDCDWGGYLELKAKNPNGIQF